MSTSDLSNMRGSVPTNPGLLKLIRMKWERHWKPSTQECRKGFRGWHQRGYLPHFDAPNVTQIVTFMLADSFPVQRRTEWEPILNESDSSTRRKKLELWLDRGHGKCWLRNQDVADIVESTLLRKNGKAYLLRAWCVMPNHVHLLLDVWESPLSQLVKSWKGSSSRFANQILNRTGTFWQRDYFDTLVRDDCHFRKAVGYVERNPAKAGLIRDPLDWKWSSAGLRDEYLRLPWEKKTE